MKFWTTFAIYIALSLTLGISTNTNAFSPIPMSNPVCGEWLIVYYHQYPSDPNTWSAHAILPDGAANPYIVSNAPNLTIGIHYCIYNPVIEALPSPITTIEGYYVTQKITSWSSIDPGNIPSPSANFDAWPQTGDAPLPVRMHIVSTNYIINCFWEYGDGTTGTSCDAYHDHTYTSAGNYTVKLTVSGPGGSDSVTRDNYITVYDSQSYSISGLITDYNNSSFEGMSVYLQSTDGQISDAALSDNSGNYIFANLPAGTYTIGAGRGGYIFEPQSQMVTIPPIATDINFARVIDINKQTISGRVTDPTGTGIANVYMEDGNGGSAYTNSEGYFSYFTSLAGRLAITPHKEGYVFSPQYRPVVLPSENPTNLEFVGTSSLVSCPNRYIAEYFDNPDLSGNPSFTQCEDLPLNYDWGTNGPGNGISPSNFSVRWTGKASFQSGDYEFIYRSDDGIHVWLNNELLIDNWTNPSLTENQISRSIAAGEYYIKIEYYNSGGSAVAKFRWENTPPTGIIEGRIRDRDENKIADVTVKAESNGKTYTTQTDSLDGLFALDNLPLGTYTVTPSKAGYSFRPTSQTVTVQSENTFFVEFQGTPCDTSPSTKLDVCQLQKGDILLAKGEFDGINQVVRIVAGTYWFHAAIYLGNGYLAHATGPSPVPDADQVKPDSIYDTYWWSGAGLHDWAIIRPLTTPEIKEQAIAYAESKANQSDPYILYNTDFFNKNAEDKFYCSQLVWQAYKKQNGGPDLEADRGILTRLFAAVITPDDLYYSIFENKAILAQEKGGLSSIPEREIFWIFSPANLLLIDPAGRRTGFDPVTHQIEEEIPNSDYSSHNAGVETLSVQATDLHNGAWKLVVTGTGTGNYTLATEIVDSSTPLSQTLTLETNPGQTDIFQISSLNSQNGNLLKKVVQLFLPIIIR